MSTLRDSLAEAPEKKTRRSLAGEVVVTRRVHFNAAHRLHNPDFPDNWNAEIFGPCNNSRWHGHNYVLEVSVKGQPDPRTGYVIDLGELKSILEEEILTPCDHRNLNEEVPFLEGLIPSTENLVIAFWGQLKKRLGERLYHIRLFETERNFADYYGE